MGSPKAKYWKAYYITKDMSDLTCSQGEKDKIAAELFKEAADSDNEFPEAQLRYALIVTQGKGVEKNTNEAIEYLAKAANNGLTVANLATFYFSKNNEALGKYYMVMAANKNHRDAIDYCKKNSIPL